MSTLAERLYLGSSIRVQQVMVAAWGWWWYRRRFGKHYDRLVRELRSRERWTAAQFRKYQELHLRGVLTAARNSSYYRDLLLEAGVSSDMPPLEALHRLPLLSKETLRARARDLVTQKWLPRGTRIFTTSGTTGTPTEIYYTREFHALELAVREARTLNWAGVSYRNRRVMFGMRKVCHFEQHEPPFWRISPVENMAYASVFHLAPQFLAAYVAFLRAYKPDVIMGFPSALNVIARYALETGDLPAPAKAVCTTSEAVAPRAREAIEAAWQCSIYDHYGCVEECAYAAQCEHGRYHVSPEVGIIEILDGSGHPCGPAVLGEVVCTGLQNLLQPLIRYRIGDVARWSSDQSCPCGRQMPVLESIDGRAEDICYTPDGRQILAFDSIFEGMATIREAQVVQERLDAFTVRIVSTNGFGPHDVDRITRNMRLHVGNVSARVEVVSVIPRTSSGKFRAVVCNLPREERQQIPAIVTWISRDARVAIR